MLYSVLKLHAKGKETATGLEPRTTELGQMAEC